MIGADNFLAGVMLHVLKQGVFQRNHCLGLTLIPEQATSSKEHLFFVFLLDTPFAGFGYRFSRIKCPGMVRIYQNSEYDSIF